MPFQYSNIEKVEMILIFGECARNATHASQIYAERFPDRPQPDRTIFKRLIQQLNENGSFLHQKKVYNNTPTTHDLNQALVLNMVENNPQISTREISRETDISQSSVSRILKRHNFHPYHIELHQELHGDDFENRVTFCRWAEHQIRENPEFFDNVLFTDESTFKNNGKVNKHNLHYWAVENPHWMRQTANQNHWSLNVWGGVIGQHLIGPHFFNGNLNGAAYAHFLHEDFQDLLDDIPLNILRREIWFQQDGAPPHYSQIARAELQRQFGEQWISRGGPIHWPARSPDLTSPDFFLWGTVQEMVYRQEPTTRDNMRQRIIDAFAEINNQNLAATVVNNFKRRIRKCIEVEGHHFEHLM